MGILITLFIFISASYAADSTDIMDPGSDGSDMSDPALDDPVLDDPVLDDPVLDDPVLDDPVLDDPVLDDPVLDDPVLDDPVLDDPVLDDPVLDDPVLDDPVPAWDDIVYLYDKNIFDPLNDENGSELFSTMNYEATQRNIEISEISSEIKGTAFDYKFQINSESTDMPDIDTYSTISQQMTDSLDTEKSIDSQKDLKQEKTDTKTIPKTSAPILPTTLCLIGLMGGVMITRNKQ